MARLTNGHRLAIILIGGLFELAITYLWLHISTEAAILWLAWSLGTVTGRTIILREEAE